MVYYFDFSSELAVRRLPGDLSDIMAYSARETYLMGFVELFQGNSIVQECQGYITAIYDFGPRHESVLSCNLVSVDCVLTLESLLHERCYKG